MSEEQWEILEIGKEYVVNEETGVYTTREPIPKYLLRRKK